MRRARPQADGAWDADMFVVRNVAQPKLAVTWVAMLSGAFISCPVFVFPECCAERHLPPLPAAFTDPEVDLDLATFYRCPPRARCEFAAFPFHTALRLADPAVAA